MHRDTRSRQIMPWWVAFLAVGMVLPLGMVLAQLPITTTTVPTYSGALLRLQLEAPVVITTGTGATATSVYQPAGRFQIRTDALSPRGGDPTRGGDENRTIASVIATDTFTSKITVAVDTDPADPALGFFYDVNELARAETPNVNLSLVRNYWPIPLAAGTRDIAGEFRLPVVFDANDVPTEYIKVRQVTTVIGDAVMLEFVITNTSTERHRVGLRILVDAMFGGSSALDGTAISLPDGRVITSETIIPDPLKPNDILPSTWLSLDDRTNPKIAVRGTLSGAEVTNPGIASSAAGAPSSISFGQMRNIGLPNQYYFQPSSQAALTGEDWGYATTWNPVELAPGESRRFVTYYGLGSSAADYDPPYALMAYAPFVLKAVAGDDPATTGETERFYYTDDLGRSPFPLAVFMDNFGTSPLLDASVRISLPPGMQLESGESASKSAGTIQRNEIRSVSFNVQTTAVRPGRTEVKYTGPRGKVLTRDINIPAIPVLTPLPGSLNGLEMVSIPYQFNNTDAEWVFQSLDSLLPGGPSTVVRYLPMQGYKFFSDPYISNITPGIGFWLLNRNRTVVELPADATPVDDTQSAAVDLKAGWNQIGTPFLVSQRFDQIKVQQLSGGEWTMEEAVGRNILLPTLFAYDPAVNDYTWELELQDIKMDPYMGYWVLAREDCALVFPPPASSGSSAAKAAAMPKPAEPAGAGNWRVGITVSTPGVAASMQSLAVRAGAGANLDRYDVAEPPASVRQAEVYLKSAFYPGESAVGMPYLVDARSPATGRQEWNLVVRTNALNQPVTVNWPSLESLPRDLIATLVDPATGARQYMRTTTGYTFRSGAQPTERVLKIVVQPRPTNGLALSGVQAAAARGGSVGITYTLSADAAVDVRVRNMAGVVVSTPAKGRLAPAGANVVLWNGQSDRGTAVPSGRYLCEVTARSAMSGEAVSLIAPLDVRR